MEWAVRPAHVQQYLALAGSQLIAFFCALNALFDVQRMNWVQRIIVIPWFLILCFSMPWAINEAGTAGTHYFFRG
jgi:hypothetical protein